MSLKDNVTAWGAKMFLQGKLPKWVYRLVGKKIGEQLKLQEGGMAEETTSTKKWYLSKGVITGIVTVLIGLYSGIDTALGPQLGFDLPNIPEWVFILLGSLGVYSRVVASGTITK